jgi:hypothetical protein
MRATTGRFPPAIGLTNVVPIAHLGGHAARATSRSTYAATLLYEPVRTTTGQPSYEAATACYARFRGGRCGGDPSMACKRSGVQQEARTRGRRQREHSYGHRLHDCQSTGVTGRDFCRPAPLIYPSAANSHVPLTRGVQGEMHRWRKVLALHEQLRGFGARAHPPGIGSVAANLDAEL